MEMTMFRLTARGLMDRPRLEPQPLGGNDALSRQNRRGVRFLSMPETRMADAEIYDFRKLAPGNTIVGPAVIHTPITTIVLQDNQRGTMDRISNVVIELDA